MTPDFETFRQYAQQGNVAPVWKALTADLETPVSAYWKLAKDRPDSFLLESVEGGERIARYTYLGVDPFLKVVARGDQLEIREGDSVEQRTGSIFDLLPELTGRYKPAEVEGLPPFSAGAVGYVGYDLIRLVEPRVPPFRTDDLGQPDAVFLFFSTLIAFDHLKHEIRVVANVRTDDCDDLRAGYEDAVAQIESIERTLAGPLPALPKPVSDAPVTVKHNMDKATYYAAVEKCKEYILAGDAFQIVFSQRLEIEPHAHPFQIYRALRAVNPSPYLFYLQMDDSVLLGSSPEMLVKVEAEEIEYRPIAGTRPRGRTEAEDEELAADLLADEKEVAEHVMLVDLGRNDVGRVAEFGSVNLPEFKIVERYSHVMHIVSGVRGKLRNGLNAFDALAACFPAGTVSGAPKVRAMEIIAELEPTKRGFYSGSVMYLDFSGNLNSCIAIRTMLVQGDKAYLQAGGGIVADSVPETEWQETMNKAGALLRAVEKARDL